MEEGTIYPPMCRAIQGPVESVRRKIGTSQHRASPSARRRFQARSKGTEGGEVDGEKLLAGLDGAEITARRSAECAPQ